MGEIEPVDPFEPLETEERRTAAERADAAGAAARPDWLVGADEGVAAELERNTSEPAAQRPTLFRPEVAPDSAPPPRPASDGPVALKLPTGGVVPRTPAAPAKPVPEKPTAWTAAASSLPTLRVVQGGAATTRSEPPDARLASAPRPTPDLRLAPKPAAPQPPDAAAEEVLDFPDDAGPAVAAPSGPAFARPRLAPPREAWWLIAVDALRGDRRVQALAALVLVLVATIAFWPRQEKATSLGTLRREPHVWDGRRVRVAGRVGDVFQVGGGHAFYLLQGRDTLVVFTRSRTPRTRDRVSVKGSISTGWLDGRPRQALFEDPTP